MPQAPLRYNYHDIVIGIISGALVIIGMDTHVLFLVMGAGGIITAFVPRR